LPEYTKEHPRTPCAFQNPLQISHPWPPAWTYWTRLRDQASCNKVTPSATPHLQLGAEKYQQEVFILVAGEFYYYTEVPD
jgi:hypothetical protein